MASRPDDMLIPNDRVLAEELEDPEFRHLYWISALRLTLWNLRRGNFIPPWRRTSRIVLWGHRRFDRMSSERCDGE